MATCDRTIGVTRTCPTIVARSIAASMGTNSMSSWVGAVWNDSGTTGAFGPPSVTDRTSSQSTTSWYAPTSSHSSAPPNALEVSLRSRPRQQGYLPHERSDAIVSGSCGAGSGVGLAVALSSS